MKIAAKCKFIFLVSISAFFTAKVVVKHCNCSCSCFPKNRCFHIFNCQNFFSSGITILDIKVAFLALKYSHRLASYLFFDFSESSFLICLAEFGHFFARRGAFKLTLNRRSKGVATHPKGQHTQAHFEKRLLRILNN